VTAAICSTVHAAAIGMPHATVVRRAEGSVLMLGARNRVAARWKRAASADPNDDQGPKERPLAGPRAPLKAALRLLEASADPNGDRGPKKRPRAGLRARLKGALQPLAASADPNGDRGPKKRPLAGPRAPLKAALRLLAASGAPGRRVPPAVPVRQLAGEASPTPGNPRPRVPPRHTLRPVEASPDSNLERPIANFC
jgi:hypothetical protein